MDEEMEPGRIGKKVKNAISVVELPGGRIKAASLKTGQSVEFRQG